MGDEVDDQGCGKNGYVFLMTLIKLAGGIVGSLYISLFCAATCPIAVLMGYTYCVVNSAFDFSGKGVVSYIMFMAIFNVAWINALTEYDSRQPSWQLSQSYMFYGGLLLVTAVDIWLIKKKLHKWANKLTNKELRAEYKALKREKK